MAGKSYSNSALNDYFEAMSFQDEEEKTWQEYTDLLVSKLENLASSFRSLPIPIDIRALGSSVEKLRIISPENIGDVDVMVFSLAEETRITESIMEYSIPGNPAFVRLRGKDNPVLQHCLAENSDYVASVTLKDFHPKVFGNSAGFFNTLPKIFRKLKDIPSYEVVTTVQSTSGPSIKCDFSQSRGSLRAHVTEMKGYRNFKANDEIRGFYEWMAMALNPGKPFTDDHSAMVDETSKYLEETVQKVGADPSIQNFGDIVQEIIAGPKTQELRTKFQELDTKAAKEERMETKETQENVKQGTEVSENPGQSPETGEQGACESRVEPEEAEVNEETKTKQKSETEKLEACASQVEPEEAEVNEETKIKQNSETEKLEACVNQVKPKGLESTDDTRESSTRDGKGNFQESLHNGKDSTSTISEEKESKRQDSGSRELNKEIGTTDEAANPTDPPREGEETDMAKMTEQKVIKSCIENILQMGDPSKSQEELQKEYLEMAADQTRQKGGIDLVPAFLAKGWPSAARAWISRDRLWPNQSVISSILDYGFHLVAKTPNESERPDLDFRLSFSHAELVLSKELNDVQRQCYRCFKSYHLTIVRSRKQKTVATYFLKTILFWAIEETGMEFWNSENRGYCVMMLLRKLLKALETRFLSHFFIPEFNLLRDVAKQFPEEMEYLAGEVRKVCEDPMSYPNASAEDDQGTQAATILEPMSDPSAEEIGGCLTAATSGRLIDANLQSQEDVSTKKQNSTLTNPNDAGTANSTTAPFFPRFKDYRALYRQVYREMLDLALSDEAVDTKDPTIRSIVTNMRKVMEKMETDPRKEMEVVLEHGLEGTYTSSYLFHTGPTPRERILSVLKGQCEMFAYVVRQEDLVPGNEHVIANRMLNSSSDGSADPFDLSVVYPEGNRVLANMLEVLGAQFEPKKQSPGIEDDIPLD